MALILHIEDDAETRAIVKKFLERAGHRLLEASDGPTGFQRALHEKPDLILLDIRLPGMDGYETATLIRSHQELDRVPIVVLSGAADRSLALSLGCDGVIDKPLDTQTFTDQIKEFLEGKREKLRGPDARRHLREYSGALVERLESTVRELSRSAERLRDLDQKKTEFMQNLSHELATPLTPLAGYLDILRGGKLGALTDPQRRVVDTMSQSVERLARTIDNLVDFVALETGGYRVARVAFDAKSLAQAVLDEMYPKARAKRLHTELDVKGTAEAVGDERKIRQAVGNLVDNAIKFSPHGGEVLVALSLEPQFTRVAVYDQGRGIAATAQAKVFEPFFHSSERSSEERAPGAGLGLPVAKQIVGAHGGRIWIESPPKTMPDDAKHHFAGTLVAFEIPGPAALAAVDASAQKATAPDAPSAPAQHGHPR
jgi:signal transduction histidine kinase